MQLETVVHLYEVFKFVLQRERYDLSTRCGTYTMKFVLDIMACVYFIQI